MIPYFRLTAIPFWPIPLQVWGILVATGIVVAIAVGASEVRRRGVDPRRYVDWASLLAVGSLVGGRVGHLFLYGGWREIAGPLGAVAIWRGGMSIFGGFLGAGLVAWIWFRRAREPRWRDFLEATAFAYPLGEAIGRIGCFLIHDHPGIRTDFFLAVNFPDGPRLDHGLLLVLANAALFALFLFLKRRPRPGLFYLPLLLVGWGVTRLVLDFWRATDLVGSDVRFLGLTPAQYGGAAMVVVGAILLSRRRKATRQERA